MAQVLYVVVERIDTESSDGICSDVFRTLFHTRELAKQAIVEKEAAMRTDLAEMDDGEVEPSDLRWAEDGNAYSEVCFSAWEICEVQTS